MTTGSPNSLPKFSLLPRNTRWLAIRQIAWTSSLAVVGLSLTVAATPKSVYRRAPEALQQGASEGDKAAQAERIVASCLANIGEADSVSLRVRQKVRIGNKVLVGTGRFVQEGRGELQRFRFETSLTCDTESFESTEVSDALFFWSHRQISDAPPELQRIDIERVRARLEELKVPDPTETAPYLGGFQRLLWWTRQWFWFKEAVPAELAGRPVWLITGRTPQQALGLVMPELAEAVKQPEGVTPEMLPDGWPWEVRLAIGRADLLPYRIEFLAIPGSRPVESHEVDAIAVIDIHDMEINGPVDPAAFFYQPATEGLIDVTTNHVKHIGALRP